MRTSLNASLAILLFLVTGCGSLSSRWRGERGPYVGVKLAAEVTARPTTEAEVVAAAVDIPLSALVDTLFLPYDLTAPAPPPPEREEVAPAKSNAGRVGYGR